MKCVVDSNYLQDPDLRAFLQSKRTNTAVFPDYAFIEATKDDTLNSVYKSLAILAEYPRQVVVLKTTWHVCGLHGRSRGLQRRLVDAPRTREFEVFCRALRNAQSGEPQMRQELLRLGRQATDHLQVLRSNAAEFAEAGIEAARLFTREEQNIVLHSDRATTEALSKLAQFSIWQAEVIFSAHPAVRHLPTPPELPNTYIFRSSLSHLLLAIKWAYNGGASLKPDRLRNDMVDTHFAAYSTFFDGLLTKDRTAALIARQTRALLPAVAKVIVTASSPPRAL